MPYYKYSAPDGTPYYLNPITRQTQWEEPPPGSLVYPESPEQPYIVKASYQMPKVSTPTGGGDVKKQGPSGCNLFIFHLPNEWSNFLFIIILLSLEEEDLYYYFKDFGNIVSCRIMTDRQTGRSRGFGIS